VDNQARNFILNTGCRNLDYNVDRDCHKSCYLVLREEYVGHADRTSHLVPADTGLGSFIVNLGRCSIVAAVTRHNYSVEGSNFTLVDFKLDNIIGHRDKAPCYQTNHIIAIIQIQRAR
jgi:hypothetical protein